MNVSCPAHQFLCEQGIVHRDIHPGNIMLSAETIPEAGAEGILLDLACASVAGSSTGTVEAAVPEIMDSAVHGAAWSVRIRISPHNGEVY
jgi:serine/threonine protein kinase